MRHLLTSLLTLLLSACMPHIQPAGAPVTTAQLLPHRYLTADATLLPLASWQPDQPPTSVIIALHGFNDYSHFFQASGEFFRQHGIASYAYDQRGFGGSPQRGGWSGAATLSQDLNNFVRLVQHRHPHIPLFVLGESMGGAVVINTFSQADAPPVNGLILVAPAVWARTTMPWYQPPLLWTLAHTVPKLTLTGRGLKILASDNIPMLRALGKDPQVIKATRVEAMYGLADLMDATLGLAGQLPQPSLLLYGDHDQLIPPTPTRQFIKTFSQSPDKTIAFYKNGYHMLLRDLDAATVRQDILAWITTPDSPLPSTADHYAQSRLGVDIRTD
ncbi:alpha/beta hydrolase [Methylovulum psychrotolerans]|uniref:Alpha/beta hydrolase n=1 Tax=Methylovulum psychrotolerans TaxID=1704499 RepID=A0A1Z4BVF0_9GAMM|nr:alpha/beta hydrolase [Methylovulum psychrotolerans]ASF45271.1 alpha/beta hydrolase [Methylovulum psychrotolerans]